MDTALTTELDFAKELAQNANAVALKYYKTELDYKTKSDNSPVTIADEEINQMVIDNVKKQFPDDGVLGEEQSWHLECKRLWVCDPIDGTIAFSMGEPTFMFSIALVENGMPIMAVVSSPVSQELSWATKGGGAFCNGQPIHVSSRTLHQAWLIFPTNLKWLFIDQVLYQRLADSVYQTNMIHGAVFKGVLIAQGLADGLVLSATGHPWDYAAIALLIEEAGGRFTTLTGQKHRFDGELEGGIISSNGLIHDELITITNSNKHYS